MARAFNPRRAKIHRSYTVAEAAALFGAHRNTVRNWIKGGLPVVKPTGDLLILGRELREFLERRQASRRRKCGPGTLYCLKCREPRRPRPDSIAVIPVTASTVNIAALCDSCGTRMHRRANVEKLAALGFGAAASQTGGPAPNR